MTQRHEPIARLRRRIVATASVFGRFFTARESDGGPAIEARSIHHLCKLVDGRPLQRPAWYYDVRVQGDGLVDIQSHMVDQAQWLVGGALDGSLGAGGPTARPGASLPLELERARRWSTPRPPRRVRREHRPRRLPSPESGSLPAASVRFAFSGDTILIGGIGRTDFHTSSTEALYESLRRLDQLVGPATVLCPTHDYNNGFATTLDTERRENPFLARLLDQVAPMTLEEFRREKPRLDEGIDDEANAELVCGNITPPSSYQASLDIAPEDRQEFFEQHRDSLVIDVREPHEFRFVRDWEALGLPHTPRNVPLTPASRSSSGRSSLLTPIPPPSR